MLPLWLFGLHDTLVGVFGLLLNLLLIVTIFKRTSPAFRQYGHMTLVYVINDTVYAAVGLVCRRVIELKNGSLFHMGFGLEVGGPKWLSLLVEFLFEVVCMQATVIIPTQYYYRYVLISKSREPTLKLLISLSLFGLANSVLFGLTDLWSVGDSAARGRSHYERQLDSHWGRGANGTIENFVSANDVQDLSTIVHFVIGALLVFCCYGIALVYTFKTLRVIRRPFGCSSKISKKTRLLTRQFTINLFLQTAVTQVCAVLPSSYLAFYLVARCDFAPAGPLTSSLFAWNPLADALTTLIVIKPYRRYALQLFGIRSWTKHTGFSTSNVRDGEQSAATKSVQNAHAVRRSLIRPSASFSSSDRPTAETSLLIVTPRSQRKESAEGDKNEPVAL